MFWPKMAVSLALRFPLFQCVPTKSPPFRVSGGGGGGGGGEVFPSFLPEEVNKIRDPFARTLARRIERLPVQVHICVKYAHTVCDGCVIVVACTRIVRNCMRAILLF